VLKTIEYALNASQKNIYSEAVIVNDLIFLSGIVSEELKTGELMPGDIEYETEQVMKNLSEILEKYGSGLDKVIRVEIFLRDFKDKDRMDATYVKFFPNNRLPSRVCVQVADLFDKCKLEILVTAFKQN